jgi:excisionase family DNA binding protein
LRDLEAMGYLKAVPMAIDGHHDFGYRRATAETLMCRVSPEDGNALFNLYAHWPPEQHTKPVEYYTVEIDRQHLQLGVGYRLTDAAIRFLKRPQAAPTEPTATVQHDNRTSLTPKDVADLYQVDLDKVYEWIKTGILPAVDVSTKPGSRKRRYAIRRQDLDAFDAKRLVKPPAAKPQRRRKDPNVKEWF